jgi:hypothetical protein
MQVQLHGFDPLTQNSLCSIAGEYCVNADEITGSDKNPAGKFILCKTDLVKTPDKTSARLIHQLQKYETSLVAARLAAHEIIGHDKSITVKLRHGHSTVSVDHYRALRALIYADGNKKTFLKTMWEKPAARSVKKLPGLTRLNKVA